MQSRLINIKIIFSFTLFFFSICIPTDREPCTGDNPPHSDSKVYLIKQTIRNACGAIAILNAVANAEEYITFKEGSVLKDFFEKTRNLSPEERAEALMSSSEINDTHYQCAQSGQTACHDPEEPSDLHFIAFVHRNGHLYECDGRKAGPVYHGPSSENTFLFDAVKVCREQIKKHPTCMRFSAIALSNVSAE